MSGKKPPQKPVRIVAHINRADTAFAAIESYDIALLVAFWRDAQTGDRVRTLGADIAHSAAQQAPVVFCGDHGAPQHCGIVGMHAARKMSPHQ